MKRNYIYKTIIQEHVSFKNCKLKFALVDEEGNVKGINWKSWSASTLEDKSSVWAKNTIKKLAKDKAKKNIGFSRLILLNECKSFESVMNFLEREGIKVSARGLKF